MKVQEDDWRSKRDASLGPSAWTGSTTFLGGEPSLPGSDSESVGSVPREPVVVPPPQLEEPEGPRAGEEPPDHPIKESFFRRPGGVWAKK
eukprot:12367056-Alexandrium_andersonii.AAC.1